MLEYLNLSYLQNLEVLNLSGTTNLKEFHFETPTSTLPLRRLDMLPMKYNGGQDFLSKGLNWNDNDVGARILLSDAHIFEYLPKMFFGAKCFSQFHICISSSIEDKQSMPMPMDSF